MFEFFNWVVGLGLIQSDPQALATGVHSTGQPVTEAEYREVFQALLGHVQAARQPGSGYDPTFAQEMFDRAKGAGILLPTDNTGYWANDADIGAEGAGFLDAVVPRVMQGATTTVAPQVPSAPHPAEPGAPPAPQVGTATGVLAGGTTVRVRQDDGTYRWYQVYAYPPGSDSVVAYQFDSVQQVDATFGVTPAFQEWKPIDITAGRVVAVGAAEEVIGMAGDWNTFSNEIAQDAARRAGARDPSLVGRVLADPEMQRIMAQAVVGNWTPEQILAEQRKTAFWQDVLYPGIERFYEKTVNPEKAWLDYNQNVEGGLIALGYQRDADGTFNTSIKKMLDLGLDDQVFMAQVPTFQQATQNIKFAEVLNQWTQRDLGKTLTFDDWFGLVAGESLPELQQVAERASLAYQASQAKAGISDAQVERLAAETDMSQEQAASLFGEFNRAILALGEQGLKRGDLSRDEVLSAAAGIDPESGRSIEEVRLLAAKLAQENDLFDEEQIQMYVGYNAAGAPIRPGLSALAPESA